MNKRSALLAMAGLCCIGMGGCASLDLGPPPATYVGPGQGGGEYPEMETPPAASQPETAPSSAPAGAGETGVNAGAEKPALSLSVEEAILTSLQNNPALRVQRLNPLIQRTLEEQQRAAFDPMVTGQIEGGKARAPIAVPTPPGQPNQSNTTNVINGQVGVQQFFPTGTTVQGTVTTTDTDSLLYNDETDNTRVGMTVTQSLLQGFGLAANLATLRESELDTRATQYELRGFAETQVAQVEEAYWDYALAQKQIEIFEESVELAKQQLDQANSLIRVGKLAETERAAAEAEVATRQQDLIQARSTLEKARLNLLQLISPGQPDFWQREITLKDAPFVPKGPSGDVNQHVALANELRSDLNQARLEISRGDLEIVRTRNGLLPRLDLFITLGKSGYATSFGKAIENLDGSAYDFMAGLKFEQAIGNRDAQAQYHRAVLTKEQTMDSLHNLEQLMQVDVRSAFVDVVYARQQIDASGASRRLEEINLRTEMEKLRIGKSTSLLVAQAQRDFVSSQITEVQATTAYLKAIVELYRQEGSLLERRHIEAPGREMVKIQGDGK